MLPAPRLGLILRSKVATSPPPVRIHHGGLWNLIKSPFLRCNTSNPPGLALPCPQWFVSPTPLKRNVVSPRKIRSTNGRPDRACTSRSQMPSPLVCSSHAIKLQVEYFCVVLCQKSCIVFVDLPYFSLNATPQNASPLMDASPCLMCAACCLPAPLENQQSQRKDRQTTTCPSPAVSPFLTRPLFPRGIQNQRHK